MFKRIMPYVAACTLALASAVACAQYPDKPIRLIIPFPAGSVTDTLTRASAADCDVKTMHFRCLYSALSGSCAPVPHASRMPLAAAAKGEWLTRAREAGVAVRARLYVHDSWSILFRRCRC